MKDCFNYRRVMRLTSNVRNAAFSVLNILPAPYIYMCVCVYIYENCIKLNMGKMEKNLVGQNYNTYLRSDL